MKGIRPLSPIRRKIIATDLTTSVRDNGITVLKPAGRMDIEGTGKIDLQLNVATTEEKAYLPQPVVRLVLEKTGIPELISIHVTIDAASAAVHSELKRPS